jgi:hypothetical protein
MNGRGSAMKNADEAEEEIAKAAVNVEVAAESAANKADVRKLAGMLLRLLAETTPPRQDAKTPRPRDVKNRAGRNLDEKICGVAMSAPRHPGETSAHRHLGEMIVPLVEKRLGGKSHDVKPLAAKNPVQASLISIWTWMLIWTATISCPMSRTSNWIRNQRTFPNVRLGRGVRIPKGRMNPADAVAVVAAVVVVAEIVLQVKNGPPVPLLPALNLTKQKKIRLLLGLGNGWKRTTRISRM